jgi:hypothetical protein
MIYIRRVCRLLVYLSSVAVLLLCGTVTALWIRSYFVPDMISSLESWVTRTDKSTDNHLSYSYIVSSRGHVSASKTNGYLSYDGPTTSRKWKWSHQVPETDYPKNFWTDLGFINVHIESGGLGCSHYWDTRVVGMPYWLLTAILIALSTFQIRYLYRRDGTRCIGVCSKCGYDLRATPYRCPECGKVPSDE